MTNEVTTNLFFEVKGQLSPLPITVTKREFVAPKEWRSRYKEATNNLTEFFAAKDISTITNRPDFLKNFTNTLDAMDMPGWHYKNIGVDINIQDIDVAYPDSEKDSKEARKVFNRVASCLEPY